MSFCQEREREREREREYLGDSKTAVEGRCNNFDAPAPGAVQPASTPHDVVVHTHKTGGEGSLLFPSQPVKGRFYPLS